MTKEKMQSTERIVPQFPLTYKIYFDTLYDIRRNLSTTYNRRWYENLLSAADHGANFMCAMFYCFAYNTQKKEHAAHDFLHYLEEVSKTYGSSKTERVSNAKKSLAKSNKLPRRK